MEKILFVDDDPNLLSAVKRSLRKQFDIETALGSEEGLKALDRAGDFALVVADMKMPGMNGIELLQHYQKQAPDLIRIMLTGNADQATAMQAVNEGRVFQFLTKPCSPEMLTHALNAGLEQHRLVRAEKVLMENTVNGSIKMLTDIVALVQPEIFGRCQLLRSYLRQFVESWKIRNSWELEAAAMLSHIGYVTVPAGILRKRREGLTMTGDEIDMLARVPGIGGDLIANIPRLEPVAEIVRFINKSYDGTGLPAVSIAGEEIPVGSRILKVLIDLIGHESRGESKEQALKSMQQTQGQYDPRVLDAAFVCFDVYLKSITGEQCDSLPVKVTDLHVDQILAADLETTDGVLLVPAGNKLTPLLLERLRNFSRSKYLKEPVMIRSDSITAGGV